MNIGDLLDNSESSDEDYVPDGPNVQLPSEEESDGEAEDDLMSTDNSNTRTNKRQRKVGESRKKRKIAAKECHSTKKTTEKNNAETEQKGDTDSLWADFIKDTGFKSRAERSQTASTSNVSKTADVSKEENIIDKSETNKKIKITEVLEFAGEEVKIEKEVSAESEEARLACGTSRLNSTSTNPAVGGRLNSFLNNLGKKRKITTLEKSKLDWEKFKKDEDIADELQAYSKSKDGYLERQDFLQRADLRRFEIEKGVRNTLRSNRLNNLDT